MPRFGKAVPPALKSIPTAKSSSSKASHPSVPGPYRTPTSATFSAGGFSADPEELEEVEEEDEDAADVNESADPFSPFPTLRTLADTVLSKTTKGYVSHVRQDSIGPLAETNSKVNNGGEEEVDDEDDHEDEEEEEEEEEGEDEDVEEEEEEEPVPLRRNTSYSSYSSSQLHPPFYNRPPTPLPPSPSLTSLFRPAFSRTSSQRTSPSDSDAESRTTTTSTSLLFRQSHANAKLPRAHPKVPTYEYYGFVLYVFSSLAFLMYILWAYLPAPFLHSYLRITYYPSRWWALAIPCQLIVSVLYIFAALASYNTGTLTRPVESIENLLDNVGQIAALGYKVNRQSSMRSVRSAKSAGNSRAGTRNNSRVRTMGSAPGTPLIGKKKQREPPRIPVEELYDWQLVWNKGTDAVLDIPVGGVCEVLYGGSSLVTDSRS